MKSRIVLGSLLAILAVILAVVFSPRSNRETNSTEVAVAESVTDEPTPYTNAPEPPQPNRTLLGARTPKPPQLPLATPTAWNQPPGGGIFASFAEWTQRYAAADQQTRQALEQEGVTLAKARLNALANLLPSSPEQALKLAIPQTVRQGLPATVQAHLEQPVNTQADYEVLCVLSAPETEHGPGMFRAAHLNGEKIQVFTFGEGLDYLTRHQVPVNGIAVPVEAMTAQTRAANAVASGPMEGVTRLMALDPRPVRLLEQTEAEQWAASQKGEPLCSATRRPWSALGQPTAVELGGQIYTFSSMALAESWAEKTVAGLGLSSPEQPLTAAGLPIEGSSYTEGRKRFIVFRVDFPDYQGERMTTNQAIDLINGLADFHAKNSYGKFIVAPVGEGTDITPTMRLPLDSSNYRDLGALMDASRAAATALGYDMSKYDFPFVCTASRPEMGWAGLGWVGGAGFWLMNGYWDVRTCAHEHGHNLGFGHANWWNTGGKTMIGDGSSDEYGDDFDTMGGSGGGVRHFSSYLKNRANWIPNSDCPTVTSSGTYRLHAQDIAGAPIGTRGLRFTRSGGDYWLEFRQLWTGNKAMMNGTAIRWVGGGSTLLDMNPGSSRGKDDHPLTIGRTFSEPNLNFHITVLQKANTYPESLDIVVNMGTSATNRSPIVAAQASPQAANPGQMITFTATALDPNGDTLAYFWDFGDGDYSTDNSATTTHSFGSAGKYYVEVTVSDMKGGTAHDSVLLQVGNPTTYSISGRILDTNSLPVNGIRVSVDSSHYAFTESDGTYTISGLNAGSYTLTPMEPVLGKDTFVDPYFDMPVTVGPDFTTADFIRMSGSTDFYSTIVPKLSNWKYLDDGSDQGTSWRQPSFNDTGWSNGIAVLGYGDDQQTVLNYGTNSNQKFITYYFRKTFSASDLDSYASLLLEVLRDDGVIVYLNGNEVFRDNMETGPITYLDTALQAIEADAYLQATLPISALQPGNNVIAAEVHQANATSSDLTFDLAISGLRNDAAAGLNMVYLSSPSNNDVFTSPASLVVSAFAQSGLAEVDIVSFYDGASKIGDDTEAPFSVIWDQPATGNHLLRAVARAGSKILTSAPVTVSIVPPSPLPLELTFIPINGNWSWFFTNTAAPAGWQTTAFNASTWPVGTAKLGYANDSSSFSTVLYGGPSSARYTTAYFRKPFIVQDPASVTNLFLAPQRDDGIVVYLNGVEVLRNNILNDTSVTYSLLASNAPDNGNTLLGFNISPENLVVGTNVLAAEVHQSSATSSDLVFALGLTGFASTNRERGVWVTAPTNGEIVSLPGGITFSAEAVAGANLGINKLEYYVDGAKVAQSTKLPFVAGWSNCVGGSYQVLAVATDTAGGTVTSTPVNITVVGPALGTTLISFGDEWKYLDDGSDQGANWITRSFNDRTWSIGPSKLGYGGDGELTTVSYGPDVNSKHITTYFRKSFTVPNPLMFDSLLLRLVRDDGVIVYINGHEVFRNNLLPIEISFNSLATANVGGTEETQPLDVSLSTTNLVAGTNVIAVEIHQGAINSSDLGFNLSLIGLNATNVVEGIYLTSPVDGTHYNAPASVTFASYAVSPLSDISSVAYYDGQNRLFQSILPPYNATWGNVSTGTHVFTAHATLTTGTVLTSPPVTITVSAAPQPTVPVYDTLIPAMANWKFWDNATPVESGWQDLSFDDSIWPTGAARFGWGYDGERTALTEGRLTHYFRHSFIAQNPGRYSELLFELARDDGAVVYLNGREVFRSNMPAGVVDANTPASGTVNTPEETYYYQTIMLTAGSGLLVGSNVVAVELHQGSASSSDAGFDLRLIAAGTTEPRVYLSKPENGSTFALTETIELTAQGWAGTSATLTRVNFFIDDVLLWEDMDAPYTFPWNNLPPGQHVLKATAADNRGRMVVSDPVNVTISLPTFTNLFIPAGAIWKYLDNGSNQGTNWTKLAFNDNTWSNGLARLGYGDDGEITTVRFGPSASSKYITTYFRHQFLVPAGAQYTNLVFRLLRDDGAVVWLNGREVFRSNMDPDTPVIGYTDRASAAVSGSGEQTFYATNIAPTYLVPGTNVVAVEVHQSAPDSSDLAFDLELSGQGSVSDSGDVALSLSNWEGQSILSWPAMPSGFRVYSKTNLTSPDAWVPVIALPTQSNGSNALVVPDGRAMEFYRLGRP